MTNQWKARRSQDELDALKNAAISFHLRDKGWKNQKNPPVKAGHFYKYRYVDFMVKVTVPCSCGLSHAVNYKMMTKKEMIAEINRRIVIEKNITKSMDMFFVPIKWKRKSFRELFSAYLKFK